GGNLDSGMSCRFSSATSESNAMLKLGTLAENGGPAPTVLPDTGSAAVDSNDCTNAPSNDQRGIARPQGKQCDSGAGEVSQNALTMTVTGSGSVSATSTPTPTSGGVLSCSASSGSCLAYYLSEQGAAEVSLIASVPPGQSVMWGGDCATGGTSTTFSVSM